MQKHGMKKLPFCAVDGFMNPSNVDKGVLLIIDGLGDLPVPELAGKTPLEAAYTPVLDQLAGSGRYGLVDPIIPGEIPNTHSGTGMLMGLLSDQAERLSRGPVEAAGAGRVLEPGDVAVRANFASLEPLQDGFRVLDRRAGRISSGTNELAALLNDMDLGDSIRGGFLSTDQHRGALILTGPGLDASVSDTDPGNKFMPARLKNCEALAPAAELTASKINRFISEAHQRLVDHPINITRVRNGLQPANGILTRGAGTLFELDNTLHKLGLGVAVITGCNTVRGLGRIFGFTAIVDSRFTATVNTDLHAKIATVVSSLRDHDMVFVHVKAPDICSHDLQPLAKCDFLQRLDASLQPLLETGAVIAVAADHTTNSNTGFHTADPVPALICKPNADYSGAPVKFGEGLCRQGNMDRQLSGEFLSQVLETMGYSLV
jgi:2,3-bisphosphoglycerate-independent phosphoglycerate mutase